MKFERLALVGLLGLFATGCPDKGPEDSDSAVGGDDSTVEDPCEGKPVSIVEPVWTDTGVTVDLECYTGTGFDFGMAETIDEANGWFGEDCLDTMNDYKLCHSFTGSTGSLVSLWDEITADPPTKTLDDIEEGKSTLFDKSFDDGGRLTYYWAFDDGKCYTSGQNTKWYTDAGCESID